MRQWMGRHWAAPEETGDTSCVAGSTIARHLALLAAALLLAGCASVGEVVVPGTAPALKPAGGPLALRALGAGEGERLARAGTHERWELQRLLVDRAAQAATDQRLVWFTLCTAPLWMPKNIEPPRAQWPEMWRLSRLPARDGTLSTAPQGEALVRMATSDWRDALVTQWRKRERHAFEERPGCQRPEGLAADLAR